MFDGERGSKSVYALIQNGEEEHLSSKTTVQLKPGDVISYRTSGGGGYGSPKNREPEAVLSDVLQGKISAGRARERYGVAVDIQSQTVDKTETERLRSGT
ncbi:MAG TPA: hypothetical protein DHV68_00665 [Dehalococcoidia bacterium]|nr:hypothetical protein [Dehalococcoidia bacterium]